MDLDKLYLIADRENISLFNAKIKNKAITCKLDNNYYIGLNFSKIGNCREEKEIFAEELGHYYCNALYNVNSDYEIIDKKEYRAKKWAFNTLAPASSLLKLKEDGCKYSYEFAEELDVSEDLINTAYSYYKENNIINF